MARKPHDKIVKEFKEDLALLGYSNTQIAERLDMDEGNLSKIINGKLSNKFLKKFQDTFGDELKPLREKYKKMVTDSPEIAYTKGDLESDILELKQNYALLKDQVEMQNQNVQQAAISIKNIEERQSQDFEALHKKIDQILSHFAPPPAPPAEKSSSKSKNNKSPKNKPSGEPDEPGQK